MRPKWESWAGVLAAACAVSATVTAQQPPATQIASRPVLAATEVAERPTGKSLLIGKAS